MDPNLLLRQLAEERNLRTRERETHAKEVKDYEKIMSRFDNISNKLVKKLQVAVKDLSKYQQQCIKNALAPEIKKITLALSVLKQSSPEQILVSLGNMKTTIDKIGNERRECEEETNGNYEMYLDVEAQEDILKELSPEKYAQFLPQLESLRHNLKQALDTSLNNIITESNRARDLIYQYFVELDNVIKQKGYMFDFSQFNAKYNRVKDAYLKVFGQELPVNIQFSMDTSRDEQLALELARQFETQSI